MSGIGAGHNKFKTCKGCPDRCADPNCHDVCKGYKYRQKKTEEAKQRKKRALCRMHDGKRLQKRIEKKRGIMINEKKIKALIREELEQANKINPLFADDHHAYAVIKEEVEETEKEAETVRSFLKSLWWSIKHNRDDTEKNYVQMKEAAIRQIQEAIQVAAMCDKALASKK